MRIMRRLVVSIAVCLILVIEASEALAQANTGTIKGRVRLTGKLPGNPVIRMGMDPMCSRMNAGKRILQEYVVATVEGNLANAAAVRAAVGRVCARLRAKGQEMALLIPDTVVRIFVLHFDSFPRAPQEAIPMLRWKLKKSVPFEAEETLISYMRQAPKEEGVDIVTGLARLRIVREYELLVEAAGMSPGVVMSSTLAALPLLDDHRPTMLVRISGSTLTTAIVREGILCGYRCTELPTDVLRLSPQALLDEIYPVAAYYQDSWSEGIQSMRLAGLAERMEEFRQPLEQELRCPVGSLLHSAEVEGRLSSDARPLADRQLDALIGWRGQGLVEPERTPEPVPAAAREEPARSDSDSGRLYRPFVKPQASAAVDAISEAALAMAPVIDPVPAVDAVLDLTAYDETLEFSLRDLRGGVA